MSKTKATKASKASKAKAKKSAKVEKSEVKGKQAAFGEHDFVFINDVSELPGKFRQA